jgi:hypothetical protein
LAVLQATDIATSTSPSEQQKHRKPVSTASRTSGTDLQPAASREDLAWLSTPMPCGHCKIHEHERQKGKLVPMTSSFDCSELSAHVSGPKLL